MTLRAHSLLSIRDQFQADGSVAALNATRAAYEDGRIDRLDVPEVLLALKSGSPGCFEQLGRTSPGGFRHSGVTG